jgi:hypothetical protein
MSARDPKIRRKDLKSPDEFQTATQRVLAYARAHERETLIAFGGFVVLIAVVLGVRGYRSWQNDRAAEAFREAFRAYAAEDLTKARQGFEAVSERWGGNWGGLALVYLGDTASQSHDAAAARSAFERALAATREPTLQQIAEYNLGVLKRNAGDAAAADEHFRRAAGTDGPLRAPALVALAVGGSGAEGLADARAEADELLPPELREFVAARAPAAPPVESGK